MWAFIGWAGYCVFLPYYSMSEWDCPRLSSFPQGKWEIGSDNRWDCLHLYFLSKKLPYSYFTVISRKHFERHFWVAISVPSPPCRLTNSITFKSRNLELNNKEEICTVKNSSLCDNLNTTIKTPNIHTTLQSQLISNVCPPFTVFNRAIYNDTGVWSQTTIYLVARFK